MKESNTRESEKQFEPTMEEKVLRLQARIKYLEKRVRILEIVGNKVAAIVGIKVEQSGDIVVIS